LFCSTHSSDTWKALAPVPTKRGSPVIVTVADRMYVIGGATTPVARKRLSCIRNAASLSRNCGGVRSDFERLDRSTVDARIPSWWLALC
jgi:hypothetical protein